MNNTAKHCLITGASRGIGRAIAEEFASKGYHLSICCSHSSDKLYSLAKELEEKYQIRVLCFIGDVGEEDFITSMVTSTLEEFKTIDVLINNAGISRVGLLTDMTRSDWDQILSVNLSSVFSTCRTVIPSMVNVKSGHIINISSVWGNVGASCEVAYSACKGGINSFTKALGKELAPSNISVNAIACGCIDTSMNDVFSAEDKAALCDEIPAGRFGLPQEVAALAYQIATSTNYLTSQIITLDGGWT